MSERDLKTRLRTWVNNPLCIEAADEIERLCEKLVNRDLLLEMATDEIERLQAREKTLENTARINLKAAQNLRRDNERLRTALKYIVEGLSYNLDEHPAELDRARRALEGK